MRRSKWLSFLFAIFAVFLYIAAEAGTATGNLNVTGTISGVCTIDTSAGLAFNGNTGGTVNSSTTVAVNCYNGGAWSLGVGGAAATPSISVGTGTYYAYAYSDAGYTTQLPLITSCAGSCITGTGTGSAQSNTIYFRLAGATSSSPIIDAGAVSGTFPMAVSF